MVGILGYHYSFAQFNVDPNFLMSNYNLYLSSNPDTNIRLVLKDRKGSSSIAIENHITANNSISFKRHVMRASLKTHTAAGRLLRTKNSFKLSPDEKKLAKKRYD